MARGQPQRQLGHTLRDAAAGEFLEHHAFEPPLAAQPGHQGLHIERATAVEMGIAVVAGQELVRPGDAQRGHLRAFDRCLRDPALHDANAQRAVDMALEAAAAAVEGQRQRLQRLRGRELQDARCGCGGTEHDADASRIKPVVLCLAQVEAAGQLGTGHQRGQEHRAAATADQFGGGQRCGDQGRADVRPRCHRIAVVERAAQRRVELCGGRCRQAVAEVQRAGLGRAAALDEQLAQRRDAVLGHAGQRGADIGQQHLAQDGRGPVRDVLRLQAADEICEQLFGAGHFDSFSGSAARRQGSAGCRSAARPSAPAR